MKNSLRKACILVALDMLDSDNHKKKPKSKDHKKKHTSSSPDELAIDYICELANDAVYDSTRMDHVKQIYDIAETSYDSDVRSHAILAIGRISKNLIYDSYKRECAKYIGELAI